MAFNTRRAIEGAAIAALIAALPVLDPLINGQSVNYKTVAVSFAVTIIAGLIKGVGQAYNDTVITNVSRIEQVTKPIDGTVVTNTVSQTTQGEPDAPKS